MRVFRFYGGKVIMDIENMQNQLFFERSDEFLKEFHMKKDDYKQCVFKDLEELLGEKNAKYIVISPLYSSFVTQSYEYRLGVYGKDLYLSNLDKSIYRELPLMKRYITEDFATIDKYMLNHTEIEKVTELIECFVEYINKKNGAALNDFNVVYGLYMERGEHFFSGNIV